DEEGRRGEGCEGGKGLDVAAAGVAGGGAAAGLLALGVEVAELAVVAVAAEGAEQPRELPLRGAQPAAQIAELLQPAELGQQRPAAAGRAVAALPGQALAQGGQGGGPVSQDREEG